MLTGLFLPIIILHKSNTNYNHRQRPLTRMWTICLISNIYDKYKVRRYLNSKRTYLVVLRMSSLQAKSNTRFCDMRYGCHLHHIYHHSWISHYFNLYSMDRTHNILYINQFIMNWKISFERKIYQCVS